jgi:hypothetical protein
MADTDMSTEDVVDAVMDQTAKLALVLEDIKNRLGILIAISLIPWIIALIALLVSTG